MKALSSAILAAFLAGAAPGGAHAAGPVAIAVPLVGPSAILGNQALAGAQGVRGAQTEIRSYDTACEADAGEAAARRMVDEAMRVVVGFLCTPALEAALPVLAGAGVPAIAIGARTDRLLQRREQAGWPLFRIAPGASAEADAVAAFVRERWAGEPFAIVEDGSSYGRDLADNVRATLEAAGLRPILSDNFRPAEERQFGLARRIAQSGIRHVLVFATRGDTAIVARDALEVTPGLQIAAGESLLDEPGEVPLPEGVVSVASGFDVDWEPSETPPPDEGYGRIAAIGTEIAIEAVRRADADGRTAADVLSTETFATSGGLVRFEADGTADLVPFRAYRWDGTRFVADSEG